MKFAPEGYKRDANVGGIEPITEGKTLTPQELDTIKIATTGEGQSQGYGQSLLEDLKVLHN